MREAINHFASVADIDEFVDVLRRYEAGEIDADAFRTFRLARGVYGQRQPDVQMIRVKVPGGLLTVPQLEALADVASDFSRGFGHITTRQNIQFHFVKLQETAPLHVPAFAQIEHVSEETIVRRVLVVMSAEEMARTIARDVAIDAGDTLVAGKRAKRIEPFW